MNRKLKAEHKAWQKYKKWQKQNADKIREGQEITSLGEFKIIYNEAGRKISVIKSEVQFQTSLETYRAFNEQYKKIKGKKLSTSARKLNTHDLADMLLDDIYAFKEEEMKKGATKKEANLAVSTYFFGS